MCIAKLYSPTANFLCEEKDKLLIDRCGSNTMTNQKISVRLEQVDNIRDCFRQ